MENRSYMLNAMYSKYLSDADKSAMTLSNNLNIVSAYETILTDSGDRLYRFPRYYDDRVCDNYTTPGQDVLFDLKYPPRNDEQSDAINAITNNTHGTISARVGFGKTYIAIASISRLKLKTLIIVPNLKLMDQWIEKICEYTNLTKDDLGIIRGKEMDFDKPICLATTQTLSRRASDENESFLSALYDANFGITFYDEVHTTASTPEFKHSTKCVFSSRVYGLSATPYRSDGLGKLIGWYVGGSIYDNVDFINEVCVLLLDIPLPLGNYAKYISFGGVNSFNARYGKFLDSSDGYTNALAHINDVLYNKGRRVINLSSRISILETISEKMETPSIVATSKNKNVDMSNGEVILATNGIGKMGLDVDGLDTLVYATPLTSKVSLVQSIGRVTSRDGNANKRTIVVDIMNSEYETTISMRNTRMRYYDELKARVIDVGSVENFNTVMDSLI